MAADWVLSPRTLDKSRNKWHKYKTLEINNIQVAPDENKKGPDYRRDYRRDTDGGPDLDP
jgi:hypothetical protein